MITQCCNAHEMCLLILGCFCSACKWSISDGQIGQVDGIDELAVLVKSLDSVGCSLSLDSLTETWLVLLAICWAVINSWQSLQPHPYVIIADHYMLTLCLRDSYYARIVLHARYSLTCSKLSPANRRSPSYISLWRVVLQLTLMHKQPSPRGGITNQLNTWEKYTSNHQHRGYPNRKNKP